MSENVESKQTQHPFAYQETLHEFSGIIGSAMEKAGYGKGESQSIAEIAIRAIAFGAGGRQFYLPKGHRLEIAIRNLRIFQEFTGANISYLCRKYGLGATHIYAILKVQREAAKHGRQANSQD